MENKDKTIVFKETLTFGNGYNNLNNLDPSKLVTSDGKPIKVIIVPNGTNIKGSVLYNGAICNTSDSNGNPVIYKAENE